MSTEPRKYRSLKFEMNVRLDSENISPEQLTAFVRNLRGYARRAAYDAGVSARMVHVTAEVGEAEAVPENNPILLEKPENVSVCSRCGWSFHKESYHQCKEVQVTA
jgi:hypothetical protein